MNFHPTIIKPNQEYTFTLGDKVNLYYRLEGKKAWKACSDTNPHYLGTFTLGKQEYLLFHDIVNNYHTDGKWIGRFCPPQPVVNRLSEREFPYHTHVTIRTTSFFMENDIAFRVIPQKMKPV